MIIGYFQTIIVLSLLSSVIEAESVSARNGWTHWSSWSKCSRTCHCGSQYRTRECHSIPKVLGGPGCSGSTFEIRKCNDITCDVWSPWGQFSPCTCSCGGGIKAQSRECYRRPISHGGPGCPGNSTRIQACNTQLCRAKCSANSGITGKLPDESFSASSVYPGVAYAAKNGRLNSPYGWCPRTKAGQQYLQIDLKAEYALCAIATQGHKTVNYWTTSYTVETSLDGTTWHKYKENDEVRVFKGNTERNKVVQHALVEPEIRARYIRFHPKGYANLPCMRAEVYGKV